MSIEIIETHSVLPDIIHQGSIVVDCGANVGRFSLEMIKSFDCFCYAIEAAPNTFKQNSRSGKLASLQFCPVRNRQTRYDISQ